MARLAASRMEKDFRFATPPCVINDVADGWAGDTNHPDHVYQIIGDVDGQQIIYALDDNDTDNITLVRAEGATEETIAENADLEANLAGDIIQIMITVGAGEGAAEFWTAIRGLE